eukprot:scaffold52426_cov27-Tisochrysis_lutea.AAC.3
MDVVARCRAILCGEVRTHHAQLGAQAQRHVVGRVNNARVHSVGLELEVRSDAPTRISADDVEVA